MLLTHNVLNDNLFFLFGYGNRLTVHRIDNMFEQIN